MPFDHKTDPAARIGELEDTLKNRDKRILELKHELDEATALIGEERAHIETVEAIIEQWKEAFEMVRNDDGRWTWPASFVEGQEWFERYRDLLRDWNRFVPEYNAMLARLNGARKNGTLAEREPGRPLKATPEQRQQVWALRDAGTPLRAIAQDTGLGLQTVRTLVGKIDGSDRTNKRLQRIVADKIAAARWLARKRTRDGLPRSIDTAWGRWLKNNFILSQKTAIDYMRIARRADEEGSSFKDNFKTINDAVGRESRTIKSVTKKNKLKSLFDVGVYIGRGGWRGDPFRRLGLGAALDHGALHFVGWKPQRGTFERLPDLRGPRFAKMRLEFLRFTAAVHDQQRRINRPDALHLHRVSVRMMEQRVHDSSPEKLRKRAVRKLTETVRNLTPSSTDRAAKDQRAVPRFVGRVLGGGLKSPPILGRPFPRALGEVFADALLLERQSGGNISPLSAVLAAAAFRRHRVTLIASRDICPYMPLA